jgi:YVTN family beta-propeller protein
MIGNSISRLCLLIAGLLAVWPARAGSRSGMLDVSRDGTLLVSANRDNGSITAVDLASRQVLREIPVGSKPEGVTFIGQSNRVAVAVYGDDQIVLADLASGQVVGRVDVFDEPYGVVCTADGAKLYATLEYPGQVVEIDVASLKIVRTFEVGAFLRGLAIDEGRNRLYATEYFTAALVALDLATGRPAGRWQGSPSENLARQVVLHPDGRRAFIPHIRSRVNVHQGEGSVVPIVSVVNWQAEERQRKPLPMDALIGTFVVANPWEVALSADGNMLCAIFAGTDDMYVCDVLDDGYRELAFKRVIKLGTNPRAACFNPAGSEFYVYNTLDFEVAVYDATSFRKLAAIKVCQNPLGEETLRGKVLFYSALQPMVGRRWISCASCHPDGDADARTWQNPEGLRNTTALHGMAWTHPIHWSADRDEVQDFEHTVRGPLMQGRGLIRGMVNPSLDAPNKGLSADLDALAVYSNSHKPPMSPHAKKGLSEAALRGKQLFFSNDVGCALCHAGPFYTDSTPARPYKLHDVGTGSDDPTEKLGPNYDTPTLLNVYRTAPYLHHGKAQTLAEVLTTYNRHDRHGKTSHLNAEQIEALVEFLKSLPYEDPEPAASAAGITKIEK